MDLSIHKMVSRSAPDSFRLAHFVDLQRRVNARLRELAPQHMEKQLKYGWLYGAWGSVPARAMFICENPSLKGCEATQSEASVDKRDGNIQWSGDFRAKRFREALCRVGLKEPPAESDEGWRCYITNVVKEVDVAGDHRKLAQSRKVLKAEQWANVLAWEWSVVKPARVFAVGEAAYRVLRHLQSGKLIPDRPGIHQILHYSSRESTVEVVDTICAEIEKFP